MEETRTSLLQDLEPSLASLMMSRVRTSSGSGQGLMRTPHCLRVVQSHQAWQEPPEHTARV